MISDNTLAILGGRPVRETPIFYARQYIDDGDISAVAGVLKSDFLTCGPEIGRLEKKLCASFGAGYAVLAANGTAALHAACHAAGIGPGDEVITTPMTFAASANCVLYCGGVPVFADIDPDTFEISARSIADHITDKTKAVVVVDYAGQTPELSAIQAICKEKNLILIEDAAHSIGTRYKGTYVGNIADLTTFSFHPVKTITGGEGGAILTNNESYDRKLSLFRTHGITRDRSLLIYDDAPWYYEQLDLGFNYRMTDMQAALISSQLDKLPLFSKRRKEIARRYDEAFSALPECVLQKENPGSDPVRHLYILRLRLEKLRADRRGVYEALKAENIVCNVHYIPVYYLPYYQKHGYARGSCPNAEKLYREILTLPLYYAMTDADVDDVIAAVHKVLTYYRR